MVSAAGGRKGYVAKSRHKAYRKLRKKGNSKSKSARIANAGVTKAGRQAMARKAAATRKRNAATRKRNAATRKRNAATRKRNAATRKRRRR